MKRGIFLLILALFLPPAVRAIGPHEILILINTNVPDSVRIGETYAHLRHVPETNLVYLSVKPAASMSADAFKAGIFDPVLAESKRRGIEPHIQSWVYAPGFPWKIDGNPALSLTGLTFLRGVVPPTNSWAVGEWLSPYFAGPHMPNERGYDSRSLDMLSEWLGTEHPIAGWVLAHTGERGLSLDEAGAMLIRGIDSDSTRPEGLFCFITNRDVRTQSRVWQIPGVEEELSELGCRLLVTNAMPRGVQPLAGLMMGAAEFDPKGVRLSPGALVDNLTSFGAAFDMAGQTKCTAWLVEGAAATGGTVTEPFSYWTKFPHARLFVHQANGCAAIESFYQSMRQPLQYLPMGDPLAAPWKPKGEVKVEGLEDVMAPTNRYLTVSVSGGGATLWSLFRIYIDGRDAGGGRLGDRWPWSPANLEPGRHEIRVVVRSAGLLRHQVFLVRPVVLQPRETP